jgi:hypothetical protein
MRPAPGSNGVHNQKAHAKMGQPIRSPCPTQVRFKESKLLCSGTRAGAEKHLPGLLRRAASLLGG